MCNQRHRICLRSLLAAVLLLTVAPVISPPIVQAAAFANSTPISIPEEGTATPYPSTIPVSGLGGVVAKVSVTLHGFSHTQPGDVHVLVVSPTGQKVLLMVQQGGSPTVSNATLTFDDNASSTVPTPVVSGRYRPPRTGPTPDGFLAPPAPSGPYETALAAFNGTAPNGTWSLFVVDDGNPDAGNIGGGWSLDIATTSFINGGAITIPEFGNASPSPSTITVAGLRSRVTRATVTLLGLSHTRPTDLDILLVGPTGQSVMLMSDISVVANTTDVTLAFDDDATSPPSAPLVSGSFRPFNAGDNDTFFPPAPGGPYGSTLAVFNGTDPNGTWSLFVRSDNTLDHSSGSIARGWLLALTVEGAPTISAIADQTVAEDVAAGPISFTVGDDLVLPASLSVSAVSSDQALLPNAGIALDASGAARTLTLTPTANQSGTTTVTVTVDDGSQTASRSFVLTVTPVDDPPTISAVPAQIAAASAPLTVSFAVADVDTPPTALTVTATSSDSALVPPGGIAVGGSGTERTVTLTPAPGLSGPTTITLAVSDGTTTTTTSFDLTVIATPGPPPPSPPGAPLSPRANLSLRHTDIPDPVPLGRPLTYTLIATNAGPATATGVTLLDTLPIPVTFRGALASQGRCGQVGRSVRCDLGSLAGGASANVQIVVTPRAAGSITNRASLLAVQPDGSRAAVPTEQRTTIRRAVPTPPVANLAVSQATTPSRARAGRSLTYVVSVANLGPDPATSVRLVDTLPSGIASVSATSSQGAPCARTGRVVNCQLGTLARGGRATVRLVVRPSRAGTLVNTARAAAAESDPNPLNNLSTRTTAVAGGP